MLTAKFLYLQSFYFRLMGLELLRDQDPNQRCPGRTIWCLLSVASFLPMTVAYGLRNLKNVEQLTDALCSFLVDLLALCKIAFLLWLHKDFRQLVQRVRNNLQRGKLTILFISITIVSVFIESRHSMCEAIILCFNKRDQFISSLYYNCFVIAGFSACLMSIVSVLICYRHSGIFEPDLPFPSSYPWNNRRPLNYLISYLWSLSAAVGVVLPTVSVDTFFSSLAHNLSALFEIAQLKMLRSDGTSSSETRENLVHVFQLYQECLDLGKTLRGFFRPLIFAQFMAASLHLCVLGYQLSANFLQPSMLFYAAFTAAILGQVSIYCFCGSSVDEASQRFMLAIYESQWLHLLPEDLKLARSLQIAMLRARRGCPIDGYFFEANRQTLITVGV
ncbi:hypothetical protein KR018_004291 [Drosophila ironensis]|nr:hypothetical protein KR018_004291 [Drosophila ironensis]